MKVFLLANNRLGLEVASYLKDQGDQVVGIAVHPPGRRRYADQILQTLDLPNSRVFDGSRLREPDMVSAVKKLGADLALSVMFGYILRVEFIDLFPRGVINLHPSFLPYNRGANPNIWSIVDRTKAGVTLHYIDSGVDTGDIIAQRLLPIEPVDTGETLYHRLEQAGLELFADFWPVVRKGRAPRLPQLSSEGTFHRTTDVTGIDEIDLDRTYVARELIDILRARTFPPHPGAYFRSGGRKVYVRCQLFYEEELEKEADAVRD